MKTDYRGKRVLVVGLGLSGVASCSYLLRRGATVFGTDSNPRTGLKGLPKRVRVERGGKQFLKKEYDLVVVSPGVPWDSSFLNRFRKKNIPVWSELELATRDMRAKKIVGITGTNGKTTTTALLGWILKKAKKKVMVAGNIGIPLTSVVEKVSPQTVLVAEVSSYQLEGIEKFRANIGLYLNLTPDHLKRHHTMSRYGKIKARLFLNSQKTDVAILNAKDPHVKRSARLVRCRKVWFPSSSLKKLARHTRLMGAHNQQNAMAAAAAALSLGLGKRAITQGLASFRGVDHRLERLPMKKGIQFINDSKSTNVDSTSVALQSGLKRVHLIMGGRHKGASYKPLLPWIKKSVKQVLTIGEASRKIKLDIGKKTLVTACQSLDRAVQVAYKSARAGDTILLSPACASFDQFKNFERRGERFKALVRRLKR